MKNEDLLRKLIDAAYDSGYDAAVMEKAAEWSEELFAGILLIDEEAKLGWEQHLSEAIDRREALRGEILARMSTDGVIEFRDSLARAAREALEALHVEGGDE